MARVDYDRMAADYLQGRSLPPDGLEPWLAAIEPWLPGGPAGRWPALDLGAGTGQFAAAAELRRVLRPGGLVLIRQAFPGRLNKISLYDRFFPGAGQNMVSEGVLPTVERVTAAFAGASFGLEALRTVAQVSAPSMAAYRDKVRRRADTGLRLLPDEEFAAGLAALDRAVEAETIPAPVVDRLDLLILRRVG